MFAPINDQHAIQEVGFVLTFERPFSPSLVDELANQHRRFRKELPKAERHDVFQIAFGNTPPAMAPQTVRPLSFSAFKRDASIDWRLYVENNALAINCLTYTRWKDISHRAIHLLRLACETFMRQGNNGIASISLQYIDAFKWRGKTAEYDVSLLLRHGSEYIPDSIFRNRKSALWHLHQGWFSDRPMTFDGRTLERVHLDAALEGGSYVVRMDSLLRLDVSNPIRKLSEAFPENEKDISTVFDQLHLLDKEIIRSYITEEMANRISLDGGSIARS